jgi:hypothetical protein
MNLGIDKSIKYFRKSEVVLDNFKSKELYTMFNNSYYNNYEPQYESFLISICGNYYNGVLVSGYYLSKSLIVYSRDALIKILTNTKYEKSIDKIHKTSFQTGFSQELFELHIKYKTPILLNSSFNFQDRYKNLTLFKDPFLKPFEFQKVMDNYTIFQKIQQFISGVLSTPEKEPWPISDTLKAQSKGFDKYSFRKYKHQRKSK